MKTLVRIIGGAVVLAIAVGVAGIAILKSMDFDTYRGLIAERVKAATGRDLVIAGPLKLEISLTPSLTVERVTFANASWGSRTDMLKLKRLAAEVRLLPLLKGELQVNRLVLDGLDVLLEVDGRGQSNWDLAPPGQPAPGAGADRRPLPTFNKVEMRDMRLAYRDARDGIARDVAVSLFAVEGKDAESPLDARLKLTHNGRPVTAVARLGSLKALSEATARYPIRFSIESPGLKASVDGHVVDPRAPKEFAFKAAFAGETVAAVAGLLQPAGAPIRVPEVGPVKAEFQIVGKGRDYAIEGIKASAGQSDLAGSARVSLSGRIPEISGMLLSRRIDLRELVPRADKSELPASKKGGRIFPEDPLPWEVLRAANVHVGHKIDSVVLPKGVTIRDVDLTISLKDGRLAWPMSLTAAGGKVKVESTVDGSRAPARIALRLNGDNVDWGRLMADVGMPEAVWDSKAEAAIDLRGAGNSVRALMAGLEGEAKLVLGPGRIANKHFDLAGADALTEIVSALNPFAKSDEFSMLKCAVARFKIANGVAEARDGLAVETGKMTVAGGGRIDLGSESLDLAIKPEARRGLGVGLGNLVGLVRIRGTFAEPSYGFDPLAAVTGTVGSVTGAVTGAVTGSLSAITGVLTGEPAKPEASPCQVALGVAQLQPATPVRPETRTAPAQPQRKNDGLGDTMRGIGEGIGRGLKGVLGR